MSDLRELYQEVILDHRKKPRNFRPMPDANRRIDGYNPLCGDRVTIYVRVENGVIEDVSFQGSGCAISTASASMMTEQVKGKTLEEATALFESFQALAKSGEAPAEMGKLRVFAGVSEFPVRVKCATLPWHTMNAAVHEQTEDVTTE